MRENLRAKHFNVGKAIPLIGSATISDQVWAKAKAAVRTTFWGITQTQEGFGYLYNYFFVEENGTIFSRKLGRFKRNRL